MSRAADLAAAVAAVRAASRVCREVQRRLVEADALEKQDKSPVTVADFASQAVVCALLSEALPGDPIVGEEDSRELRRDSRAALRASVVEQTAAELGLAPSEAQVLAWIDLGGAEAAGPRYWTLDPIDGTKGFLRGEQYAVALALLEDGEVVLGALGCPSLPADGAPGALFTALRGERARARPLWGDGDGVELCAPILARVCEARFCESVESEHSDQDASAAIARLLGITAEPYRIDSQCKYAAVARSDASIYLRMPTRADYREKIWDHAAGKLVVECAGGVVSDVDGAPLDFGCGATLERNRGIVATAGGIHGEVLSAIRRVRGRP